MQFFKKPEPKVKSSSPATKETQYVLTVNPANNRISIHQNLFDLLDLSNNPISCAVDGDKVFICSGKNENISAFEVNKETKSFASKSFTEHLLTSVFSEKQEKTVKINVSNDFIEFEGVKCFQVLTNYTKPTPIEEEYTPVSEQEMEEITYGTQLNSPISQEFSNPVTF